MAILLLWECRIRSMLATRPCDHVKVKLSMSTCPCPRRQMYACMSCGHYYLVIRL